MRPISMLLLVDGGSLVARCSCWWSDAAVHEGQRVGVIGHYAAATRTPAWPCSPAPATCSRRKGSHWPSGPMDGTTWRRYRFIVERGSEPVFFLEPDNPDDWPGHWAGAGFTPIATYSSAIEDGSARR